MQFKTKVVLLSLAVALIGISYLPGLSSAQNHITGTSGTGVQTDTEAGLLVCGSSPNINTERQDESHCTLFDIFKAIVRITNFLMGLAALYAIFRIVVSGAQMVLSGGSEGMIKAGKQGLLGAIKGFILVFVAFLLVNTIFSIFAVRIGSQTDFSLFPRVLFQ